MALGYEFQCDCGKKHRIEVSQAGQSFLCECGKSLKIPSMLKIKKMPVWPDAVNESKSEPVLEKKESLKQEVSQVTVDQDITKKTGKQPALKGNRLGVFIVGIILFLVSLSLFCISVQRKPQPLDVFGKQTSFTTGDTNIFRNSSPVSDEDYRFFLYHEQQTQVTYIINDFIIDLMSPFDAYLYFSTLDNGLVLSENFYDNFAEVKNMYRIRISFFGGFTILSLVVCFIPWFMPRKKVVVGNIRGSEWKV